jgi:hypothetical protein
MQSSFETANTRKNAPCAVCSKPVPVRDIRDLRSGKPFFCGRVHAQLGKFATRYRGTNSGPMDRPTTQKLMDEKTKFFQP